jgi:hypothetical protein
MNETLPPQGSNADTLEAQERVDKIKKFYKRLAKWASTSVFLVALDVFMNHGITWSKWPLFFMGISIFVQLFEIIRLQIMDKAWEDRMLRKQMGQSPLPDSNQEDYSDDLLRRPGDPVKEKADLSEFRQLKKPWKDEDLV